MLIWWICEIRWNSFTREKHWIWILWFHRNDASSNILLDINRLIVVTFQVKIIKIYQMIVVKLNGINVLRSHITMTTLIIREFANLMKKVVWNSSLFIVYLSKAISHFKSFLLNSESSTMRVNKTRKNSLDIIMKTFHRESIRSYLVQQSEQFVWNFCGRKLK